MVGRTPGSAADALVGLPQWRKRLILRAKSGTRASPADLCRLTLRYCFLAGSTLGSTLTSTLLSIAFAAGLTSGFTSGLSALGSSRLIGVGTGDGRSAGGVTGRGSGRVGRGCTGGVGKGVGGSPPGFRSEHR